MEIPQYIQDAGGHIVDVYKEWLSMSEMIDNHPKRFYELENQNGDSVKLDCKTIFTVNKEKALRFKASKQQINELQQYHQEIRVLISRCSALKKKWTNATKKGEKTFLDEDKERMLQWFGDWYTPKEVHKKLKLSGLHIKLSTIEKFYVDHLKEIQNKRKINSDNLHNSSIGDESGRLNTLSELHFYYFQRWQTDKNPNDASMLLRIIEQAKKELKRNEIHLTIDGKIDINASLQANDMLVNNKAKFALNAFIISLVSNNLRLNPFNMYNHLYNGYYSKYTGLNGIPPLKQDKSEPFPSTLIRGYDYAKIEEIQKEKEQDDESEEQTIKIDKRDIREGGKKKTELKNILKERKDKFKSE